MSNEEMNEPIAADQERQQSGQVTRTPGAQLAAYREEQGWSIEQVATQLNLAPRQVQAIENDDYRALPGMAIVRGFIRAYAKLLKVDAAPLIAALPGETAAANEPPASRRMRAIPFSEPRFPSITDQPGLSGKYIAGAAIVALLALGAWALQQTGDLAGLSGSLSAQVEKHWASVSGSAADASKPAPVNTEAASPAPVSESVRPATPGAEAAATASVAAPTAPAPAAAAADAPAANKAQEAAAGKDSLVFKLREDSWIEVRRPDNRIVIARLAKAGTTETVDVTGPLSVVIGNASGVDVALRGKSLELKASTSSNIARLSVK